MKDYYFDSLFVNSDCPYYFTAQSQFKVTYFSFD